MMFQRLDLLAATGLMLATAVAEDPFTFCEEGTCAESCPVSVGSTGTGFPSCVIYSTDDIFAGQGFNASEGG
jgi:hypothetical protein